MPREGDDDVGETARADLSCQGSLAEDVAGVFAIARQYEDFRDCRRIVGDECCVF